MLFLKAVWVWLKKYWKYLLFPVGILLGLLAMRRRKVNVVAPELLGAEENRRKVEKEAAKQLKKAEKDRRQKTDDIEKEHAVTIQKLTQEQREKLKELREDPDELNSFLLQVGKDIRVGS